MSQDLDKAGGSPPPLSVFNTQLCSGSGHGSWTPGLSFALGFTWDPSHSVPQPVVELAGQPVQDQAAITVDAMRRLVIDVDASSVKDFVCPGLFYLKFKITIAADGASFAGAVLERCESTTKLDWKGTCPTTVSSHWLALQARYVAAQVSVLPIENTN